MADGHFHALHTMWRVALSDKLNDGLLPEGYYALPEQHSEGYVSDVSTYDLQPTPRRKAAAGGGTAVAEPSAERRVIAKKVVCPGRRLAIRLAPNPRIVAVIELVSTGNKDRRESVGAFAGKVAEFLRTGVHVLVIDILPPTFATPNGMHAAIWTRLDPDAAEESLPEGRPLLVASYRAKRKPIAYLNSLAVGQPLPPGPLYLDETQFVEVPLEKAYADTYRRLPKHLKVLLQRRPTAN